MSFYVLSLQEAHDAGAAIMCDGVVVAAVSEERFSRLKCDYGYPRKSIEYCLREAGITAQQLNTVALCSLNWNPVLTKIKRNANFKISDWVIEQEKYWAYELGLKEWYGLYNGKIFSTIENGKIKNTPENKPWNYYDLFKDRPDFIYDDTYPMDHLLNGYMDKFEMEEMQKIRKQTVAKELGISEDKIVFVLHENAHKYYSYFGSELSRDKKAIVLTNEGIGDYSNCSVSILNQFNIIQELDSTVQSHVGHIFQYVTLLLGMLPSQHEYKVMGLAPYVNKMDLDRSYQVFKDIMKVDGLNIVYDKKPKDLYFHFREALQGHRFDAIAGAVQKMAEVLLVQWVKNCIKHTGYKNIVFAGGVAQNIKACKAISEIEELENIDVLPACGDASLPIGACYYITNHRDIKTEPLNTAYLGPAPDIYNSILERRGVGLPHADPDTISDLLIQGKIVGRCSGRMEFGQRALGNRSILADPRNINVVRKINQAIKFRTWFMPFTPTILDTYENKYIVNPKNLNTKFMTMAFDSTELARVDIPAALHPADLTVRPQVLKKSDNPEYYDIIKSFEEKTGMGALLQTSLNLHGEPIVCTVEDAIRTFKNSGLDAIIIDDFLIEKKG